MKKLLAKISPITMVMGVAAILVFTSFYVRFVRQESFDGRVIYEDEQDVRLKEKRVKESQSRDIRYGENDVSLRYGDRLRDASALSLALGLYVVRQRVSFQKVIPDVSALMPEFEKSELVPPQMKVLKPSKPGVDYGIIATVRGLYLVRYRPKPLLLEILACGARGLEDGAVFIVRLPDVTPPPSSTDTAPVADAGRWASLLIAPNQNAVIPVPFASTEVYKSAGWYQEPLRAPQFSQQQLQELWKWFAGFQNNEMK